MEKPQVNWGQAPDWAHYWAMEYIGAFWHEKKPKMEKLGFVNDGRIWDAPGFGWPQSRWKDSLVKRPSAKPSRRTKMTDKKTLRPWVDATINEDGDLHIEDGIYGPDGMVDKISHTIYSLREKEITAWLKSQGWATPDEKSELIDSLKKCVFLLSSVGYNPENSVTAMVARDCIAKAKGEQG